MHELRIDCLEAILFTSSVTESVQFLNRFQRLQWFLKLMLKSVTEFVKSIASKLSDLWLSNFNTRKLIELSTTLL